jgi:DNA mismatch endonuclease (patch repair protein)
MGDIFSKKKRSTVMAAIHSHGNKSTEGRLLILFRTNRLVGWRRKSKLRGSPDFTFPSQKLAVFVDGCFWHGCPKHGHYPKGNAAFWRNKITRNKARDRRVTRALRAQGWRVLRIWEHELTRKNERRLLARIRQRINLKLAAQARDAFF